MTMGKEEAPSQVARLDISAAQRVILGIFLSALSGLFLFLAFPPVNLWFLMFVAVVPYLVAQYRLMPPRLSALAPAIASTLWLWPFLGRVFGIPEAPFWLRHLGLLIGILTYFMSSDRKFHELTGYRWFILQGVFTWVGFEMIRSFIPFLGTMGFAANPLAGQAWLIQPVSIFSIYGLNLVIVLVNYALAQMIFHLLDRKWEIEEAIPVDGNASKRWLKGVSLGLAAWVVVSLVMFNLLAPQGTQTVRVAALQPNFLQPGQADDEATEEERLDVFMEQARQAAEEGAEVIFTNEMDFGFDPQEKYTDEFRALAAETGAYLYLSSGYWEDETGFHNETVLLSPSGEFSQVYGKLHNTPGEPPTVTAGTFPVFDTPYGRLSSVICMDGNFTDASRYVGREGAQLIGIPTFNSTVGISEQNWTHFVFRSVENRAPVVNADTAYVSMITDWNGSIVEMSHTPEGGREVLVADVTLGSGNSPHRFLGDWLGWASLAGFVYFMVFQSVTERRAKKEAEKMQGG